MQKNDRKQPVSTVDAAPLGPVGRNGGSPSKIVGTRLNGYDGQNGYALNGTAPDILSYRGLEFGPEGKPRASGSIGVAATLHKLTKAANVHWYSLVGTNIAMTNGSDTPQLFLSLKTERVEGHYVCSNDFYWAVLHSEDVTDNPEGQEHYLQFQELLATAIAKSSHRGVSVHDYQFLHMPEMLRKKGVRSTFFLHVPWPEVVNSKAVTRMVSAVKGMLGAEVIAFHCQFYLDHFMKFVEQNLPKEEFLVDRVNNTIHSPSHTTQLRVSPIGVNASAWKEMADKETALPSVLSELGEKTLCMLIGRSDPAKGIPAMLRAWEIFQKRHKELAGNSVLFVICPQSRQNVERFRQERELIVKTAQEVKESCPGTVVFTEDPLPPEQLAVCYRRARILVTGSRPGKEGWGQTMPEYVAASNPNSGSVIGMSKGLGSYTRFGGFVTTLRTSSPDQMGDALAEMHRLVGTPEAIDNMREMQKRIPSIEGWWNALHLPVAPGQPVGS